jgi:hypothetical protein
VHPKRRVRTLDVDDVDVDVDIDTSGASSSIASSSGSKSSALIATLLTSSHQQTQPTIAVAVAATVAEQWTKATDTRIATRTTNNEAVDDVQQLFINTHCHSLSGCGLLRVIGSMVHHNN